MGAVSQFGNFVTKASKVTQKNPLADSVNRAFKQKAPELANISSPLAPGALESGQQGINNSMASQQALLNALGQQRALQNQSDIYGGLNNQTAATTGANGVGVQGSAIQGLRDVYGQQQGTANQLQGIVQGVGPNPAQAMLAEKTGQNVANQAALMAGQRGAGSNVGLIARQAAQRGADLQQQAVGQGATLQANQSLNALGQIGGQQQAMAGTQGAIGGLGTNQVAAAQTALNAQAGQANTMAGQQIAQTNAGAQTAVQNQGQNLGAAGNYNQAQVANQGSVNSGNTATNLGAQKGVQDMLGGALNGAGAVFGNYLADGGVVDEVPMQPGPVMEPTPPAATSPTADYLSGNMSTQGFLTPDTPAPTSGMSNFSDFIRGASQPTSQSPDSKLKEGSSGASKALLGAALLSGGGLADSGGHVAAKAAHQKAVVSGDSLKNDKIPAMLSEEEIVIPRSVTKSKDPVRGSADFVAKVLAKRKTK